MADALRPLVRSCRDIINAAGDVTVMLATAPPDYLVRLAMVAPELQQALLPLTDAVLDLDYRTANLCPPPTGYTAIWPVGPG